MLVAVLRAYVEDDYVHLVDDIIIGEGLVNYIRLLHFERILTERRDFITLTILQDTLQGKD